jgi:histidine triad (HIT) family protein
MTTIFGLIVEGKLPCKKVYEDDKVLAIEDIHPAAPIHVLVIPKKAIPNLQSLAQEDLPLIGHIVAVVQKLAEELGIEEGYRLVANNGAGAGQTVFHLHFHLLGGRNLGPMG